MTSMDMRRTCLYAQDMSKMIQVRDVPEQVHSTLKARAAREGMSLSDFIKKHSSAFSHSYLSGRNSIGSGVGPSFVAE